MVYVATDWVTDVATIRVVACALRSTPFLIK